jgi:hypothetical protein
VFIKSMYVYGDNVGVSSPLPPAPMALIQWICSTCFNAQWVMGLMRACKGPCGPCCYRTVVSKRTHQVYVVTALQCVCCGPIYLWYDMGPCAPCGPCEACSNRAYTGPMRLSNWIVTIKQCSNGAMRQCIYNRVFTRACLKRSLCSICSNVFIALRFWQVTCSYVFVTMQL